MPSCNEPAFVFVPTEAVPARWRNRAVDMSLVPLLPQELQELLAEREVGPQISPSDERLARLVAQARSGNEIARELGISRRQVERRLARLRELFGVATTAELSAFFAKKGF